MKTLSQSLKYGFAATTLLLTVGCSNSLVVEGEFPSPMIDKLPLSLGVHYEDDFRQYVYVEKSEDRSKWTIDSGAAQTQLFNTILPKMFERVELITAIPGQVIAESPPQESDSEESPADKIDADTQAADKGETETDTAEHAAAKDTDSNLPWDVAPVAETGTGEDPLPKADPVPAQEDTESTATASAVELPTKDAAPENPSEAATNKDKAAQPDPGTVPGTDATPPTEGATAEAAVEAVDIDLSRFDLLLSPRVDEFQYAMPRETKVNVFEIWIKYNMRVYNNDGQLIADWIMSAYGKTPTAFMKSKEEALNEAVIMALRDIGASLSLGFTRVPEIRAWLEQHNKTMINSSETPPA